MLDKDHPFFPQFKKLMSEAASKTPVYDLGTNARFFKEMGLVKELFDTDTYKAGGYKPDMTQGEANCDFDCDLHNLSSIPESACGSVICLSVFEHVLNPGKALEEIRRILRPGGILIASVPFAYSFHGKSNRPLKNPLYSKGDEAWNVDSSHGGYGDFWRYTHEGLVHMFAKAGFSRVDVYPIDGQIISRLELLGLYNKLKKIPILSHLIHHLDKPRLGSLTTMHYIRAEK